MPISFTEIVSAGDALPANRHLLSFPTLPGETSGRTLELRHTEVTLPPFQIGHVQARIFGYPVGFAGIRMMQNTFTAGFIDTTNSPVVKSLAKWQDKCAGFKTHRAELKAQYAVNAKCVAHDTTGKKSLHLALFNVFPLTITYGNFTEDSGPHHIEVEFNVDAIDVVGLDLNEDDFASVGAIASSETNTSVNIGSFTVAQQIVNRMSNPTASGIVGLLNTFFRG